MFRRGGLNVWLVSGWLLGAIFPLPARGQVEKLPAITSPAPPADLNRTGPRKTDFAAGPGRSVMNVRADDRPSYGSFFDEAAWPNPPSFEPLPSNAPLPGPLSLEPAAHCYRWQLLPEGLIYRSYLAGGKESRIASHWVHSEDLGWIWDAALGGRVGLIRYGTDDEIYPEGWQLDLEAAVFPRLDLALEHDRELVAADFRVGVPWTVRQGPWEAKLAYYHLSSHLGDEFIETHPLATRINYVRDCVVLGVALRPHPDLRLYTEAGWAFNSDGGAQPWEFQFGLDYSPLQPSGILGAPFFAVNGHLREEVDFGGGLTVQTGWQWRGRTGHLLRAGVYYFNGMSDQRQFFADHEELIGLGLWYDY